MELHGGQGLFSYTQKLVTPCSCGLVLSQFTPMDFVCLKTGDGLRIYLRDSPALPAVGSVHLTLEASAALATYAWESRFVDLTVLGLHFIWAQLPSCRAACGLPGAHKGKLPYYSLTCIRIPCNNS